MVFMKVSDEHINPLVKFLAESDIIISKQRPEIRLVTHLDVNRQQIESVITAVSEYFLNK